LKLIHDYSPPFCSLYFRAFTGAVSLKPAQMPRVCGEVAAFPRLHRRGLIEAGW